MVCPAESLRSMGRAQAVSGHSFDNNVELNFAGWLDIRHSLQEPRPRNDMDDMKRPELAGNGFNFKGE